MDWNGGLSVFGVGLAIFTLVAPMIWHTFPRVVIVILFIISVCLMLAWPMGAGIGLVRQYVKPPYGMLLMIVFGGILGGIIFGSAYRFTEPSPESSPLVQRAEKSESEAEILAREKLARSPKLAMNIALTPSTVEFSPYKPPLRRYELMMQNENRDSVPVQDLRVEFNFGNIVTDVKTQVYVSSGANLDIGSMKFQQKRKDGSTYAYEYNSSPTELSKKFSLAIKTATIDKKVVHLNIVDLYVERWVEDAYFTADIIVNSFKASPMKSSAVNSYTGMYYYEIKGKKFSQKIAGTIPEAPNG